MEWIESAVDTLYTQSSWYVGSAMTSCYILYYLFEVVKKPIIATHPNGKFSKYIEKKMPVVKEKFWPTLWCIESRAQTIIASLVRVSLLPVISYKREVLVLKDGGEVCLDTIEPKEGASSNTPTIIVLPGLTGSSQSEYIKGLVSKALDLGIRMVVFNQRGIGICIKTPRTYCAANCEDLVEVIDHIKAKYDSSLLGAVGISMGGLILGNYLSSTERSKIPISCAMIISVPWNVHLGTKSIEAPILNMLLNRHLASSLCEIVRKMRPILESEKYVIDDILKSKTIREFDSKYTVKQFGYKDVKDYYNHATIHNKINKITIPLLCLSSADDPFQPLNGIPIDTANKMDNVCIIVTSRGGHIGFMEGILPIIKEDYMCRVFGQYFKSMLLDSGIDYFSKETNVSA